MQFRGASYIRAYIHAGGNRRADRWRGVIPCIGIRWKQRSDRSALKNKFIKISLKNLQFLNIQSELEKIAALLVGQSLVAPKFFF